MLEPAHRIKASSVNSERKLSANKRARGPSWIVFTAANYRRANVILNSDCAPVVDNLSRVAGREELGGRLRDSPGGRSREFHRRSSRSLVRCRRDGNPTSH